MDLLDGPPHTDNGPMSNPIIVPINATLLISIHTSRRRHAKRQSNLHYAQIYLSI